MRAGGEIVHVAVGANLGDREASLAGVIRALEGERDLLLLAVSSVYESDPVGPPDQPAYLNAALRLRTWLSPMGLLESLQRIERQLGRDRAQQPTRWGPRTIDLDILFYGERCIDLPDLTVPHPRAHERAFVLRPLAELDPHLRHPLLGLRIVELASARADLEAVRAWRRPPGWPGA